MAAHDSDRAVWLQFVEAPAFTRFREDYLDDDGLSELQRFLAKNPEAGDMVPGAGGIRKLRWKDPRRGKGRRGGLRIIYYCFLSEQEVWLLTLYDKDEAADLTKETNSSEHWKRNASREKPGAGNEEEECTKTESVRGTNGRCRCDEGPAGGQGHASHAHRGGA